MRLVIAPLFALTLVVLFGASMQAGGDITPPFFVGAAPELPQIDTSNSPQTVTFTVHLTDDLSGVDRLFLRWVHEKGYNTVRDCATYLDKDAQVDILAPCGVTFPRYSAEGAWLVEWILIHDRVGNQLSLTTASPIISDGKMVGYEYSAAATAAIRAMEITIGDPVTSTDLPLYLPSIMAD